MLVDHEPLLGLRLRTPRLELRLPTTEELARLAELAAAGIHDPELMPFTVPWTDAEPAGVARSVIRHHWRLLGGWSPADWELNLAVFRDDDVLGVQSLRGRDVAITREVGTGSWLGRDHQGRGLGTEMRAAVLHLAFAGLGVDTATSGAFDDNPSSFAVSRKLGYEPDGVERQRVRDRLAVTRRLRLSREAWERHRTVPVTIDGLPACLPDFGVAPT